MTIGFGQAGKVNLNIYTMGRLIFQDVDPVFGGGACARGGAEGSAMI
jgi:hypothetical protein